MSGKLKLCLVAMLASCAASIACFTTSMVYVGKVSNVKKQLEKTEVVSAEEVETLTEQKEKYESAEKAWAVSSLCFATSTMLWNLNSAVVKSKEMDN